MLYAPGSTLTVVSVTLEYPEYVPADGGTMSCWLGLKSRGSGFTPVTCIVKSHGSFVPPLSFATYFSTIIVPLSDFLSLLVITHDLQVCLIVSVPLHTGEYVVSYLGSCISVT